MVTSRFNLWFPVLVLLCAGLCCMPVLAANGTISIAYRWSGGYYVGDTIIFDGINTAGNTSVLRIAGPGLPAEGVPLYNLGGTPGTGNTVPVDSRNLWVFLWDTSRIDDSKLQTARYTFTAWDSENPAIMATTSVILKKPEFYMTVDPSTASFGDYVELQGVAEKGVSYVKIDVTDSAGTPLHTFMAPVSAQGFFQYGFHVDMKPGQYFIKGTNPSMKRDIAIGITITASDMTGQPPVQPDVTALPTASTPATTPAPLSTQAGIAPVTVVLALCGIGALLAIVKQNR